MAAKHQGQTQRPSYLGNDVPQMPTSLVPNNQSEPHAGGCFHFISHALQGEHVLCHKMRTPNRVSQLTTTCRAHPVLRVSVTQSTWLQYKSTHSHRRCENTLRC